MAAKPKLSSFNLVELAVTDLTTAAAVLRKPRGGVLALDLRDLAGGRLAFAAAPAAQDVYLGAIDAGLSRMRGLGNVGTKIVRVSA